MAFLEFKSIVSAKTPLNHYNWTIPLTEHTDTSDKKLSAVISQNDKPIPFFLIKLSNPQHNYTTTEKEILSMAKFLKQSYGIIFGLKNTFIHTAIDISTQQLIVNFKEGCFETHNLRVCA